MLAKNETPAQRSRRLLGNYWPWPGSDLVEPSLVGNRFVWLFGGMLLLAMWLDPAPGEDGVGGPVKRLVMVIGLFMLIGWYHYKRNTDKRIEKAWSRFAAEDNEGYRKAMDEVFER
jgi:hypothetical protein